MSKGRSTKYRSPDERYFAERAGLAMDSGVEKCDDAGVDVDWVR